MEENNYKYFYITKGSTTTGKIMRSRCEIVKSISNPKVFYAKKKEKNRWDNQLYAIGKEAFEKKEDAIEAVNNMAEREIRSLQKRIDKITSLKIYVEADPEELL